jgi:hypothetical protein
LFDAYPAPYVLIEMPQKPLSPNLPSCALGSSALIVRRTRRAGVYIGWHHSHLPSRDDVVTDAVIVPGSSSTISVAIADVTCSVDLSSSEIVWCGSGENGCYRGREESDGLEEMHNSQIGGVEFEGVNKTADLSARL